MTQTATKELLALDKKEGKPLDLLREVLDTLGAQYETLKPEGKDTVVYNYKGIYLEPFLEPNSVVFSQQLGPMGNFLLITAIEQLTKVSCVSFRTQLNEGKRLITHSDLVNDPGLRGDKTAGRILIAVKKGSKDLRLLFETKPGHKVGQCSNSVTVPDCLKEPSPIDQTLDIYLSYITEHEIFARIKGEIHIWKF